MPNRFLATVAVGKGVAQHIRHLFQACWKLGYRPKRFREANTIVLKKPQKTRLLVAEGV